MTALPTVHELPLARPHAPHVSVERLAVVSAVLAPSVLLFVGAAVGYAFTLNERVALERLVGLALGAVVSCVAALTLRRIKRPGPLLVATAIVVLLGGLWVIAATDPAVQNVLRGPVGSLLLLVLGPLVGLVQLTDPVDLTNTRFIVGYNGLADLALIAIFCGGSVLVLDWPRTLSARLAVAGLLVLAFLLLVGTGSRGGLMGLAAGLCAIGLYAWRGRSAWLLLLALPLGALSILDKGLEFSSTAGRLTYWTDLGRLLVEYPFTGVGLGVDTANRVAIQYDINPDPERVFYAHNTFVQAYLEMGPLGLVGMLLVPLVAVAAALLARGHGVRAGARPLLVAGLGVVGALSAHGLTDQVLTTNVGGTLLLLGLAACLPALQPQSLRLLCAALARSAGVLLVLALLAAALVAALPALRSQALLNVGGLQLNRALALNAQAPGRATALAEADATLTRALTQAPGHPAVLRLLARARSARYEDDLALLALREAAASPRLDAFDMLQIGTLYRDFGFADEGYTWATRAYAAWGRPPDDRVLWLHAQTTLADADGGHRAQTLAQQAEAAMRARAFGQAVTLFERALAFAPSSAYLQDRLGGAQRGVERYGPGPTIPLG
jgi:O-antigen ligase